MPFIHGPHCRIRSFPTCCPDCKKPVLYWECSHGARVFFDYPIYGKPIRHICQKVHKNKSRVLTTNAEQNQRLLQIETYQCPVCGKIFEQGDGLVRHINQKKKQDDDHADFFGVNLDLIDFDTNVNDTTEDNHPIKPPINNENIFQSSDDPQDISRFKTQQHLNPNQQAFFVLKTPKRKDLP
jgi:hypothetical protein